MQSTSEFEVRGEENFTGKVLSRDLTGQSDDARIYQVIFTPGARTHWHTHGKGQTIIITAGKAWLGYNEKGKVFKKELSVGESFHFKQGLEHWHGAAPGCVMEHFAITRGETDWRHPVSEDEYFTDSDGDITTQLTNLAFAFSEAEKRGEINFFEHHLAEDLVFRRASGITVNKKSFIAKLDPLQYEYNIPLNIEVFPGEDKRTAAVSLLISAKITGEPPIEGIWRNIRLFQYADNRWQLTGWYNEPA